MVHAIDVIPPKIRTFFKLGLWLILKVVMPDTTKRKAGENQLKWVIYLEKTVSNITSGIVFSGATPS